MAEEDAINAGTTVQYANEVELPDRQFHPRETVELRPAVNTKI